MKNCHDCNHCEVCKWINEYKDKDVCDFYDQGQDLIAQERYEDLCEYFGDAKVILNSRDDFKAWLDRVKWHIRKAEELYKKYVQEPSGDLISKKAVDEIKELMTDINGDTVYAVRMSDLRQLPPVNPYCECCFDLDKYEKEKQE